MDVRLVYNQAQARLGFIDLALDGADLAKGKDLYTAVIISLFTNRRARLDDPLPDPNSSRMGWWGDLHSEKENDQIGSRLWLLRREKQTQDTLNRAYEYCHEALKWLVDDGIASQVDVRVEYVRLGVMGIWITIHKPVGVENFRFDYLWEDIDFIPAGVGELEYLEETHPLLTEGGDDVITEGGEGIILE